MNIVCEFPNCKSQTQCSVCDKQLCSIESHKTHQVQGHYKKGNMILCVDCFEKEKK